MVELCRTISSQFTIFLAAVFAFVLPGQTVGGFSRETSVGTAQSGRFTVTVDYNVPYVSLEGSDLHLDIYRPSELSAETRSAVVLIHGGGWTSGDKDSMSRMALILASYGLVAFAVDYRLLQGSQNRWPAQLDDVQRAVRWVRANAAKYGVNPNRIGAFKHSAGGTLASLLGMEETRDNSDASLARYSSKVQAVVDVSGPSDFTKFLGPEDMAVLTNLLGTDYTKHPEVWREALPVFHISEEVSPFLIVHGTQDRSVLISQAQEFFEKLQSAGVSVSFIKVNDAHTFQTLDARRELAMETVGFFSRYLGNVSPNPNWNP